MRSPHPRTASFLIALSLLAACGETITAPAIPEPLTAPAPASSMIGAWREVVDGEVGPGTSYRLYMPQGWNGKLVSYAHGIVAPFFPAGLDDGDAMAGIFGAQGYAVALSSYKETGLAIKDGAQRTHQLRGIFASRFDEPSRTYLVGKSMGGFIVASLAERFPGQYDGVMPICGVVGGFNAELAYVLDARVLFDALYHHPLPGTAVEVPMPQDLAGAAAAVADLRARALSAFVPNPTPGVLMAMTDQLHMPLPSSIGGPLSNEQFGTFVVTPLLLHGIFINDIVQHTHGKIPVSNAGTTYSSAYSSLMPPGVLDMINAGVDRVAAEPAGLNWIAQNGETTGRISMPTLTLHTRYDTWVPIATEAIYHDRVTAAGRSELLVQRTTDGFDHCNFTSPEIGQGLADLANWVEHGVKPAP